MILDKRRAREVNGGASAQQVRAYRFRWRAVLAVFVLVLGMLGALAGHAVSQARQSVRQDEAIADIAEDARGAAARADEVADVNRTNFCRFLGTLVDNPPPNPTADQEVRWAGYRDMYGAGTAEFPGLNCAEVLPHD